MRRIPRSRHDGAVYELQLTAMVDMFTIILVFLLRSYSVSAIQMVPADKMQLPASFTSNQPMEALKLVVAKHGIYVDDQKVLDLTDGKISSKDIDANDPQFIKELFNALDAQAKKSRDIASVNEDLKFNGRVIMQADKSVSYALLKKVMYTATIAGYNDFKLAAVSVE